MPFSPHSHPLDGPAPWRHEASNDTAHTMTAFLNNIKSHENFTLSSGGNKCPLCEKGMETAASYIEHSAIEKNLGTIFGWRRNSGLNSHARHFETGKRKPPESRALRGFFIGERDGIRTHDPMIKSHVLYQLSYALVPCGAPNIGMVRPQVNQSFTSAATFIQTSRSGSTTAPFMLESPFLIISTYCIPSITCPQMV